MDFKRIADKAQAAASAVNDSIVAAAEKARVGVASASSSVSRSMRDSVTASKRAGKRSARAFARFSHQTREYFSSREFEDRLDALLSFAEKSGEPDSTFKRGSRDQRINLKLKRLLGIYALQVSAAAELGGIAGSYFGKDAEFYGHVAGAAIQITIIIGQVIYVFMKEDDGSLVPVS